MNNENYYNELIYLVIDGEASEIERNSFYSELAVNQILQNEFHTAIKFNKAAEGFAKNAVVPLSLTDKLFNKTGLKYYPAGALLPNISNVKNTNNKVWQSKFTNFLSKKVSFLLLGFFLGLLIMYGIKKGDNNLNITSIQVDNTPIEYIVISEPKTNYPIIKSNSHQNFHTISKNQLKDNSISMKLSTEKQGLEVIENLENGKEKAIKLNQSEIIIQLYHKEIKNPIENIEIHNINNFGYSFLRESNSDFSFELKNSAYWNLQKESVYPSELSKFNNVDIFAYYEIIPSLKLGLGIRQETFYAKYQSSQSNRDYIFEQQPNLTNYEISLRFFPLFLENYEPFFQINFGGGNYGYTYRAIVGDEIKIYDNISLILTMDYATFNFVHNTYTNQTSKIGFNYGINFKF